MDQPTPSLIEIPASTIEVPTTIAKKPTKQKERQGNFTVLEDQALCNAWVSVAEDTIIGCNQNFKGLWARITTLFLKKSKTIRSKDSLIGRFRHITKRVNLFVGYMEAAKEACISGATHETKMTMARLTYTGDQDEGFKLDHCYEILRHCQKWHAFAATKVKKTPANIIDLSEDGSPVTPDEPDRLKGIKTSKEKKKRALKSANATDDFFVRLDERFALESTLHESNLGMREKELQLRLREVEAKEQRNKQKQRKEDARILALDLSIYSEETRGELEEQQKEVRKRRAFERAQSASHISDV
ncbi:hypothetical protein ACHQM5_007856 [Ranunculus cassubicifolius]